MNVTLDPLDQKTLEALARESSRDPAEVLRELVHEALVLRRQNGAHAADETASAARQRAALEALHRRLDAMPIVKHADGLSGSRHHDAILYGKR